LSVQSRRNKHIVTVKFEVTARTAEEIEQKMVKYLPELLTLKERVKGVKICPTFISQELWRILEDCGIQVSEDEKIPLKMR
jgi:hypothetical protein